MNEKPWSILTEYAQPCPSESHEQALNAMKIAVDQLYLSEAFLRSLNVALIERMTNHFQRADNDQSTSTLNIRILSNCDIPSGQKFSSGWGFFFIEIDQLIELYLYQDGKP